MSQSIGGQQEQVSEKALISPEMQRGDLPTHNLIATILTQLRLDPIDLKRRPQLRTCIHTAGYETTYPFALLVASPMDMELSPFLDENYATDDIKRREQHLLAQASRANPRSTFESSASGLMIMKETLGKKIRVPEPDLQTTITTKDQLLLALQNWKSHHRAREDSSAADRIHCHTNSLKDLWAGGLLHGNEASLIELDSQLRGARMRDPSAASGGWVFDNTPGAGCSTIPSCGASARGPSNRTAQTAANPAETRRGASPGKDAVTTGEAAAAEGLPAGSATTARHPSRRQPPRSGASASLTTSGSGTWARAACACSLHTTGNARATPGVRASSAATRCATSAPNASLAKAPTKSVRARAPTDRAGGCMPRVSRDNTEAFIRDMQSQLRDISKAIMPDQAIDGMVALNIASGVNMTAAALQQLDITVSTHIDVELDPIARSIADRHYHTDHSSIPFDLRLITRAHIKRLFDKYGTIDLVVISTPCQGLSRANTGGLG